MFADLINSHCWRKRVACTCTAQKSGLWVFLRPHEQTVSVNLSILELNANFSTCSSWTSLLNLYRIVEFSSKLFMLSFQLAKLVYLFSEVISKLILFYSGLLLVPGLWTGMLRNRTDRNLRWETIGLLLEVIVLNVPGNTKHIAETKESTSVKLTSHSSIF